MDVWVGLWRMTRGRRTRAKSDELLRSTCTQGPTTNPEQKKCRDLQRDVYLSVSVGWDAMGWRLCHGSIVRSTHPSVHDYLRRVRSGVWGRDIQERVGLCKLTP